MKRVNGNIVKFWMLSTCKCLFAQTALIRKWLTTLQNNCRIHLSAMHTFNFTGLKAWGLESNKVATICQTIWEATCTCLKKKKNLCDKWVSPLTLTVIFMCHTTYDKMITIDVYIQLVTGQPYMLLSICYATSPLYKFKNNVSYSILLLIWAPYIQVKFQRTFSNYFWPLFSTL